MSLIRLDDTQTTEQLCGEKIDLARSRIARRTTVQKALAQKQAENSLARYKFEATLEREKSSEIDTSIKTIFAKEIDLNLPQEQRELASFRKTTLLHFLNHRHDIVDKIRREFVVNRNKQKPTVGEILDFIMPEVSQFHLAAVYPVERQRQVNLYVLEDMNAFCGQIVGVLSGLGQTEWSKSHREEKPLREELESYTTGQDNLPETTKMEPLSEDLRIFLIARTMRLQIQAIINQKKDDYDTNSEVEFCQMLSAKYCTETDNEITLETYRQFDQLPSIAESIGKRIIGIFTPTKEKFLNQFERKYVPLNPVAKVYDALKLISELGNFKPEECDKETELYQELSRIFAEDLCQALAFIKIGVMPEAEMILDGITSAGTMFKAKLINQD
jgi:hypothetical protein